MLLSPLTDDDHSAYSHMLQRAFNTWHCARGWPTDYFGCTPEQGGIFVDFTESNQYPALCLAGSAINMDSFSLYNTSGFVPRGSYHDMAIAVPATGLAVDYPPAHAGALRHRKPARSAACAGVRNSDESLEGFMISIQCHALSILGPCVARSVKTTLTLLLQATERFRGQVPLLTSARNVETYLFQVRGKFQPFNGVSLPNFLPETG